MLLRWGGHMCMLWPTHKRPLSTAMNRVTTKSEHVTSYGAALLAVTEEHDVISLIKPQLRATQAPSRFIAHQAVPFSGPQPHARAPSHPRKRESAFVDAYKKMKKGTSWHAHCAPPLGTNGCGTPHRQRTGCREIAQLTIGIHYGNGFPFQEWFSIPRSTWRGPC